MRANSLRTLGSCVLLLAAVPCFAAGPHVHRGPTSPRAFRSHASRNVPRASVVSIAPERATQIQNALIKGGYMTGEPSGTWDAQTQAAVQKLQADNGWQTKLVPDSRAIIKLGLGPGSSTAEAEPAETLGTPSPEATVVVSANR